MAEYIEREALMRNLKQFAPEQLTPLIESLIQKQPAADVVEVKHGTECVSDLLKLAYDLITYQQAEIERLKKNLAEEEEKYKLCAKRFYKVGVKDFAEKLKSTYFIDSERLCCQVDKVFKEMVGDT